MNYLVGCNSYKLQLQVNKYQREKNLTGRTNHEYRVDGFSKKKIGQLPYKYRRPFWLSALNYYVLTLTAAIISFFVFFGILQEEGEDMPWLAAGIAAGIVLGAGIFLREVILRKARARYQLIEQQLDVNLKNTSLPIRANVNANKLSVQKNAGLIQEIRRKSEAAQALGKFPEAHLEVFKACNEYLLLNQKQMETVGIGSPRLAALRRGREVVERLHHFHLLAWAQNATRSLTQESKMRVTMSEKSERAQRALDIFNEALEFYPNDEKLLESERAVKEFITLIKVSHWIEQAERAAFKDNYKRAINHYRDALFFMAREMAQNEEKALIAQKINTEIEKLQQLLSLRGGENLTKKPV